MKTAIATIAIIAAVGLLAITCRDQPTPGAGSQGTQVQSSTTVPPVTNAAPTPEAPTATPPNDAGTVGENPAWLTQLIDKLKNEPVTNPPAAIIEYQYRGQTVYFWPAPCCDCMSILYDYSGRIIGHPDGGIYGQGDGKALDFFEVRTSEKIVWEDDRDLAGDDSREPIASTPILMPTSTVSTASSKEFADARISMREGGGMLGTVRVHTVDWTLLSYKGNFLAVANQEARTECSATTISPEDQKLLWRTLYENDVFTLGDNNEMLSVLPDLSFYAIIVEHNGQRNEFSVYAPGFLADRLLEGRYLAIVEAIRDLANLRLRAPSPEACADYQVANQTPEPTPTPVPPTPTPMPTVHRVEIGLGGSVELPNQGTGNSFDRVVEDSRCPANVVCIWAGEVVIELTVTDADTSAVVRLFLEPGSGGIESPWTRVPSSQSGSEDILIRLTSMEGEGPTAVLEVMVDGG